MEFVKTRYGTLHGVCQDGFSTFFGVPYAKPPVDELRWRPPERPAAWDGILNAYSFGAREHQFPQDGDTFYGREFYSDPDFLPPMSEDCLTLNIWTPAESETDKLPVAVWIHGGAFTHGFGSEMEFDGEAFCRRGVILVTINYRLGVFGFLCHPALAAENGGHCGNYGILDQIAALKWVKENIAAFGGDADRITVLGQSAGAMSAQLLTQSPFSKDMICGAVFQSGGGYNTGIGNLHTQEHASRLGLMFAEYVGADSAKTLRKLSPKQLMDGVWRMMKTESFSGIPFAPVIDNYAILENSDVAVEKGRDAEINYLLGSNKNDLGVTPEMISTGERGKLWYACLDFASLRYKRPGSVYVYSFERALKGDDAGAFHSAELWYVFGTLGRCWRMMRPQDYALSETMTDYWCNFISKGNPNGGELPPWSACAGDEGAVMVFDA